MGKTRTIADIDAEIQAVKAELADVNGDEHEVYARIVGYYRAVQNWNKGKLDEFRRRTMFDISSFSAAHDAAVPDTAAVQDAAVAVAAAPGAKSFSAALARYELFTRPGCPHCPPVRDYMAASSLSGTEINVDQKEGLDLAAERGVFATPTVIFYNADGQETARAHNADELDAVLGSGSKAIA